MDVKIDSFESGSPAGLPAEGDSGLDFFFSNANLDFEFTGECPFSPNREQRHPNRFNLPSIPCKNNANCLAFAREIKRMGKMELMKSQKESVFKSFVVGCVLRLEHRIERMAKIIPALPNLGGKLAFYHYITAIILMYGLISNAIDDYRPYYYHRNEARKYNRNCARILSLPKNICTGCFHEIDPDDFRNGEINDFSGSFARTSGGIPR